MKSEWFGDDTITNAVITDHQRERRVKLDDQAMLLVQWHSDKGRL